MRAPAAAVALAAAVGGALLAPAMPLAEETPAPPVAQLEAATTTVEAGRALKLDSSRSTAGATPIVGHVWDLDGDGTFETDTAGKPTVEVTPEKSGPLKVQVRVVDEGGLNADAALDLTVAPKPKAIAEPEAAPVGENSSTVGGTDGRASESDAPSAAPEPAAPSAPAAPEPTAPEPAKPAKTVLGPRHMTAAPSLVPRRALAARAQAQGRTQPVADVHAAASSGVTIKDFRFAPASVSVSVGDTITWTNQDVAPHTATANDGSFDTGNLSKGKSASHTFTKAGAFPYICTIHPSMKGTVTVAAGSGGSGGGAGSDGTGSGTSAGTADSGGGLPQTGLDLIAVVLLASLMMGSGSVLRRVVG